MAENLLVAIIAGLFGLLPVAFQWLSERSRARSRQTRIQRLVAELEFLTAWHKTAMTITPSEASPEVAERMCAYLDRLASDYEQLPRGQRVGQHRPVGLFRRAFLLFEPASNWAWLAHSLFYFLLLAGIAVVLTEEPTLTYDPKTGSNEFVDVLLGALVIFGPVLLGLQRWAIHLRQHAIEARTGDASAAGPSAPPAEDRAV